MSYQLDLDKGVKPKIEMPPLLVEAPEPEPVENQGENAQDVVENVDNSAQAAPEATEETLQPTQSQAQETYQAGHFKRLRLEAEQVKAERDELAKRIQAYETAQQKKYEEQLPEDFNFNINDDDLLEGKHLKIYAKKIQQMEQRLQQQQQTNATTLAQAQLRNKFPDFDKVVNEDNIEQLRYAYPELANTLNSSTDLYSTAVSAYTMIKNLGIVPKGDDFMAQKAQAQKNAAKPKPLASVNPQQGDSPLSKANAFANGLTDELKAQLRKEMEQARANH